MRKMSGGELSVILMLDEGELVAEPWWLCSGAGDGSDG